MDKSIFYRESQNFFEKACDKWSFRKFVLFCVELSFTSFHYMFSEVAVFAKNNTRCAKTPMIGVMQYIYLWMAFAVVYKSGYLPLSYGGYSKYSIVYYNVGIAFDKGSLHNG